MIHRVSIDSYSVSRYLSGLVKTISSSYYYTCKSRKRQPEPSIMTAHIFTSQKIVFPGDWLLPCLMQKWEERKK